MIPLRGEQDKQGPVGPFALVGGLLLLAIAPLPRGSDYFIALIPLEIISLAVLLMLGSRAALAVPRGAAAPLADHRLVASLLASPLLIALVQLTPLPADWWARLPGHARYVEALQAVGIPPGRWRPLSISPDATAASLLAGIPLAAAFLLGYLASIRQFRLLMQIVVVVAFGQVLLGLLQASGGEHSPFYFGMMTFGSPIGSLGTRNEYANFLALALAGYAWLAYDTVRYSLRFQPGAPLGPGRFDIRHALALWVAGGLVLVIGLLISRSRAGVALGFAGATVAVCVATLRVFGWSRAWRLAVPAVVLVGLGAVSLVGLDAVTGRIAGDQLQASAGFRLELWRSSWDTALAFLPFGSGWGTYDMAYRPFQPATIVGYAKHAHMDYLQMLVEGGVVFIVFAACFAWLAARRGAALVADARRARTLDRDSMLAAMCGIGLLGFLLHAAVDFPMRVPANAVLAALVAGAFLRPLGLAGRRT